MDGRHLALRGADHVPLPVNGWSRDGPGERNAKAHGERGFTLVEVVVASLLGAFVILSTEVAWWNSTQTVVRGTSQLDLLRDAGFVLDSISDAARMASTLTIGNYGAQTANLLVLKDSGGSETARFYWNPADSKLYYGKSGGTPSQFVASLVQSLSFTNTGKELTAALTLNDGYSQTATYTTSAYLRN